MDLILDNLPDLSFLNEYEKSKIIEVLTRDDNLRKKQNEKYVKLKQEIDLIESRSIDIPSEHIQTATVCVRCRQAFGYFFNTGEFCQQCGFKVCQRCKYNQNHYGNGKNKSNPHIAWLCILCHKYKQLHSEYLVQTGDWIYTANKNKNQNNNLKDNLIENRQMNMFIKNPLRHRKSSSNNPISSALNGSQLIKLSLFPTKKNEILGELEQSDLNRSTLSKRYSIIKKAQSQTISPENLSNSTIMSNSMNQLDNHNNNNSNSISPSLSKSRSSSDSSIDNNNHSETYDNNNNNNNNNINNNNKTSISNLLSNLSITALANKHFDVEANMQRASNLIDLNGKVKAISSIFKFSTDQPDANNNEQLNDVNDKQKKNLTKDLLNDNKVQYISNSNLIGDDFESVTSSEFDEQSNPSVTQNSSTNRVNLRSDSRESVLNSTSNLNNKNSFQNQTINETEDNFHIEITFSNEQKNELKNKNLSIQNAATNNSVNKSLNKLAASNNSVNKSVNKLTGSRSSIRDTKSPLLSTKTLNIIEPIIIDPEPIQNSIQQPTLDLRNSTNHNNNENVSTIKQNKSQVSLNHEQTDDLANMDELFEKAKSTAFAASPVSSRSFYNNNTNDSNLPSQISSHNRESSLDPVDEYLKLQLQQENDDRYENDADIKFKSKPIARDSTHRSFFAGRRPLAPQRSLSIKSLEEKYSFDNNVEVKGQVLIRLMFDRKTSILSCKIYSCKDLASVNKKQSCNPYIKVYLVSLNKQHVEKDKNYKRKTPVKKNTCNPSFDETLRYTLSSAEVNFHQLWLSVWHKDTFGRNKFLGEAYIELKLDMFSKDNSTEKIWYDLGKC